MSTFTRPESQLKAPRIGVRRISAALGVMGEGEMRRQKWQRPAPTSGWRPVFAEDHDSVGLRLNDAAGWITEHIPQSNPAI